MDLYSHYVSGSQNTFGYHYAYGSQYSPGFHGFTVSNIYIGSQVSLGSLSFNVSFHLSE